MVVVGVPIELYVVVVVVKPTSAFAVALDIVKLNATVLVAVVLVSISLLDEVLAVKLVILAALILETISDSTYVL